MFLEGAANLRSRPVISGSIAVLVLLGALAVTWVEFTDTHSARLRGAELVQEGYATLIVAPDDNIRPTLTAAECRDLGNVPGVIASTWTRQRDNSVHLWNESGPTLPLTLAGVEVVTIIERSGGRLWSGEQVLIDRGSPVADGRSDSFMAQILGSTPSDIGSAQVWAVDLGVLGQAARAQMIQVSPADSDQVSSCIALIALRHRDQVFDAINGAFSPAQGYQSQWALPNANTLTDPITYHLERPARFMPLVMAGALLAVVCLYLRLRRPEHAFYRVAGMRGTRLLLLLVVETCALLALGLMCASATVFLASIWHRPDELAMPAAWHACGRFASTLLGATALVACLQSNWLDRAALNSLRDR